MDSAKKEINNRKVMENILSLLKGYKFIFTISIVFMVLSTLFVMFGPLLTGNAITLIFDGAKNIVNHSGTIDFNALINILIMAVVIYLLSAFFEYISDYLIIKIVNEISFNLRERLITKVVNLPMNRLEGAERGDVLSRITNDVDTLEMGMYQTISQLLKAIITIVGISVVMLSINVWMTVAIVVLIPISFILIKILSNYSQKYFKHQLHLKGKVNSQIEETVTVTDIVNTFNYGDVLTKSFKKNNDYWYDQEWKAQFFANVNTPVLTFISNLIQIIIAVIGAYFVIGGVMPVGRIVSFYQYSNHFSEPILQITTIMPTVQMSLAAGDRIFEFLGYDDEENPSTKEFREFRDKISFENVIFSYIEGEKIIDDFSFTVGKGEKVAIIGETGAGKSTIIKLLLRLYDVDSGEIKIDGVNITEYEKNSLRSYMGMVLQDSWLFSDTIERNIGYGELDATKEEIIAAAKNANADSFIRQLPKGYETVLNEDSDNLSQGQKQLLTIARTFLSRKEILILDEATSSVDAITEKLIQKSMDRLVKNRTCFIIAHRLSTIKNADKILVLGDGHIIEQGSHDELLAKKGYYYNTLMNQN